MIPPPYTYAAGRLAEERAREPMRDGEHARLMRLAKPARAGPMDRLLACVGRLLVSAGHQLQARPTPQQPDLSRSPLPTRQ
jgi:hypothetical protein